MIKIKDIAKMQWKDYQSNTPGTFFAKNNKELSIEDAYSIQLEYSKLRCIDGDIVSGFKVGCTGPGVVEQFGFSGPIYGHIFQSEINSSGKEIEYKNFTNLSIEGEMAVIVGKNLEIVSAFPVIELHNFIFRAKKKSLSELITNNAINAGIVICNKSNFKPINNWSKYKSLSVKINNTVVDKGNLWAMPGGPSESICWLKNKLIENRLYLKPGNLVLTGTPLSLHTVKIGDDIRIMLDDYEFVNCKII